jgi:hypothetical protein
MLWFHRLFPPALILSAVVFTHLVKRRPGQQLAGEHVLLARLWIATLAFLSLHVIVQTILESALPMGSALRATWPTLIAVLGCVTLWTRFAGPALAAREPGYRPLSTEALGPAVRSASLRTRHETAEIGPRAWTFGWSIFGLATVATAWAIAEGAPAVLLLGLGWWIGMAFFGSRATRMEPEPMDPNGSPELAAGYASNRAFRSWVFFAFGLSGTTAYAFIAVTLLAWPAASGMIGAVIGSSLGVAGATFGVVASIHRARTQALLHELSEAG